MIELNKIYNMDCLEGMKMIPDRSIDVIITDPPYGIDYQSSRKIDKSKRLKKIVNDKKPFIWFLYDAYRVLKDNSCILCFCRWDTSEAFKTALEWAGFEIKSHVVWDRKHHGMGDLYGSFAPMHDIIWFAVKGKYKFPNKRPKDVLSFQRVSGDKLIHPNEKPLELMENIVEFVTTESQVILDPFIGSASTAMACMNTNRNYIGFELDAGYFSVANKRISEYAKEVNR